MMQGNGQIASDRLQEKMSELEGVSFNSQSLSEHRHCVPSTIF